MAVYTVRLGGEAAYIGPVGNDSYGELMIDAMRKKSVDTSHLRVEEGRQLSHRLSLWMEKESLEIMRKECWKLTYSVMKIWILSKILM